MIERGLSCAIQRRGRPRSTWTAVRPKSEKRKKRGEIHLPSESLRISKKKLQVRIDSEKRSPDGKVKRSSDLAPNCRSQSRRSNHKGMGEVLSRAQFPREVAQRIYVSRNISLKPCSRTRGGRSEKARGYPINLRGLTISKDYIFAEDKVGVSRTRILLGSRGFENLWRGSSLN